VKQMSNEQFLLCLLCALIIVTVVAMILSPNRKIYDTIMLWANFGVLVALFFRFARKPLMDALHGVRKGIEEEIVSARNALEKIRSELTAEESRLAEIERYIEEIQKRFIEMAEKEKQKIIEQAETSAKKMIEDAKAYARVQLAKARKQLADEMVDIAISTVEQRLEKGISSEDNEKLISDFILNLEAAKPQLN